MQKILLGIALGAFAFGALQSAFKKGQSVGGRVILTIVGGALVLSTIAVLAS